MMCTIGYHKGLNVLFKNSDKPAIVEEEIIRNRNVVGAETKGSHHVCAINRNGVCYVTASVNSPEWAQSIYSGRFEEAKKIATRNFAGMVNPVKEISSKMNNMKSAEMLVEYIKDSGILWKPYNMFVADPNKVFRLELRGENIIIENVTQSTAVTNHFLKLSFGPTLKDFPSTFNRYDYVSKELGRIKSYDDLKNMLETEENGSNGRLVRCKPFVTISSSIIDIEKAEIEYYNRIKETHQKLSF
jgi:hypothetical protein